MKQFNHTIHLLSLIIIVGVVSGCVSGDQNSSTSPEPTMTTQSLPTLIPPTPVPSKTLLPTLSPSTNTPTPLPPTFTPTMEPTSTVHGIQDPSGILPAGLPAIVDGYVMVVDKSGLTIDGDFVGFEIQLKIIGEESRLFRYNAASLKLRDDLGNYYDYYYNVSFGKKCTESDLYNPKQILIEPGEKVVIEPQTSMMYASYSWWCLEDCDTDIPGFEAVIPPEARSIILEFDGFGPFSNLSFEFEL